MPRLNDLRPPVNRRVRRAAAARVRPPRPQLLPGTPASGVDRPRQHRSKPSVPTRQLAPIRDRGLGLLIVFTAGALVMVALISLTAVVGSWWMLVPVMAVELAVTVAVLASVVRLLDHESD